MYVHRRDSYFCCSHTTLTLSLGAPISPPFPTNLFVVPDPSFFVLSSPISSCSCGTASIVIATLSPSSFFFAPFRQMLFLGPLERVEKRGEFQHLRNWIAGRQKRDVTAALHTEKKRAFDVEGGNERFFLLLRLSASRFNGDRISLFHWWDYVATIASADRSAAASHRITHTILIAHFFVVVVVCLFVSGLLKELVVFLVS